MKISTKGRYALRLLLDLAIHSESGFVALKEIAERQGISKKYLEQIVPLLNKSGLLRTNRGYQGGYMLTKSPERYSVGEILRVTEGNLCPISCLEDSENQCPRAGECMTLYMWEGLHKTISDYLDNISLQDIIDHSAGANDFVI